MAIAHDTSTNAAQVNASSLTFAHTSTGSNLILFVSVLSNTSDDITGVTYNSVAMTKIQAGTLIPTGRYVYLWMLVAPATGANNVVVTASGTSFITAQAATYTGAEQGSQPDASTTNTATATNITGTLNTIKDNCWTVMAVGNDQGTAAAGTSTTSRQSNASGLALMDSNAAKTPAGTTSLQATIAGTHNWALVMASFLPVGGSSLSPSISPSTSPSQSISPSRSPSASPSVSPSASISPSISSSRSPSISPSVSPSSSRSPSISPSISSSRSPSISPSTSPSTSPSISPSISPSNSPSTSISPSTSPSSSVSPSPSPAGWINQTKNSSTWTNTTKDSSTFTNQTKPPSTTWYNETKN